MDFHKIKNPSNKQFQSLSVYRVYKLLIYNPMINERIELIGLKTAKKNKVQFREELKNRMHELKDKHSPVKIEYYSPTKKDTEI